MELLLTDFVTIVALIIVGVAVIVWRAVSSYRSYRDVRLDREFDHHYFGTPKSAKEKIIDTVHDAAMNHIRERLDIGTSVDSLNRYKYIADDPDYNLAAEVRRRYRYHTHY